MIYLGISAFFLFVIGDLNDAFFKKRPLKACFPLGLLVLAIATAFRLSVKDLNIAWCAAAYVFLVLQLVALFGSFSAEEAYTNKHEDERTVTDTGLYAMCRHPGILFFVGLYLCLHWGLSLPWLDTIVYIMLDLALAFVEDKYTFPVILNGYDDYRKTTPFLIPTISSIGRMIKKD